MSDPFNQLPTPPEWMHKIDEISIAAREMLGASVVLIAAQETGKMCLSVETEDGSNFAALVETVGMPNVLRSLAGMLETMDARAMRGPKS